MRRAALLIVCTAACAAETVEPRLPTPTDGGFITLPDSGGVACRPNFDGVIARDEVVFAPGVEVRYRTNPSGTAAPVDTRGVDAGNGRRRWDFSSPAGDRVTLSLQRAEGQWFAATFPTAQYAAALDPRRSDLGVYRAGDAAVELLGVVGAAESAGTSVVYESPVEILRFPLRVGATWTVETRTRPDATVERLPVASQDRYLVVVDARGEVRTPAITFTDALRVRVEVTQRFPSGSGARRIQYLWMAECYGEVARITSTDGELNPDFTSASEYRRLDL
ncbi:MAG: hypothetical protein R3A48_18530 [Polyangiales bacterium]